MRELGPNSRQAISELPRTSAKTVESIGAATVACLTHCFDSRERFCTYRQYNAIGPQSESDS